MILTNGKIWTGGHSFARAVSIRGDRIASLDGSGDGPVIDLQGRLVVPGFIDNHVHFVMGGARLEEVQLRDAASREEFRGRIAAHAKKLDAGRWITGGSWDEQQWSPAVPPSRDDIDAPDHPVFVTRLDLHMGVANDVALRLAGITRDTPDPAGGTIVRDARGEPTGLLKDAAMPLVMRIIPPLSMRQRVAAAKRALGEAARHGVTSLCNMAIAPDAIDDFRAFQELDLSARIWMYLPIGSEAPSIDATSRLRIAGFKGFSDGSLGSSTAAFRDPYDDDPANRGLLMRDWIPAANASRLQLAIHAIGDRANDEVLKVFESLPNARERRLRIEHAQHLDIELICRFAKGEVIASAQPYHAVDDGRWADARIGPERARWAFAFRSLLDAGVTLTFGSDWPVAPLDPIAGIHAAVTRRWIPEQRVTVAEALRCYTASAAWSVFAEDEIGTIAPGMRADLAVLSEDLFTIAPEEIQRARVDMTIFDGRVIYEADARSAVAG
ncbi:MAG TPA: amidohydrolase [Thermoanaerobaculia bacterium]|nr:amidohydrolase [Thermoanaerobaculia bacterium]